MKIEIPKSVYEVLRCVECNELLSCGPVFLVHETCEAICGRCSSQSPGEKEDPSNSTSHRVRNQSRNLQYEVTAKLLSFPCRYSDQGCTEKMDFSEEQPNMHEQDCKFRNFFCPIVSSRESCDWIGSREKLREHCRGLHPTHLFQNPCVLPILDFSKSNFSNFLVSAFNLLFLIHIKICVNSRKLFHSVRMFSDSKILDKFSYLLEIEGNNKKLTENGSVLPSGNLTIQKPFAICTGIDNLLGILGGKPKFTITIQTTIKFNCLNCLKSMDSNSESKYCEECERKLLKCKFNEQCCLFVDFNKIKCEKHEEYFCKYQTKCYWCKVVFSGGSFIEHLCSSISCRKTMKSNIGSIVRVTNTNNNSQFIVISSNNFDTIICRYQLSDSNFEVHLFTPLPSLELKNLKCSIELTDPQTKRTLLLTPKIDYSNWCEWFIKENMDSFPSSKNIGIDIKINIDKI